MIIPRNWKERKELVIEGSPTCKQCGKLGIPYDIIEEYQWNWCVPCNIFYVFNLQTVAKQKVAGTL